MARSNRRCVRSCQKIDKPTEACKDLSRFRTAFAAYLLASAESVSEECWFTIRGRHQWGLSLHLGLDTRQYSALLLACGLVSTTKTTPGASSVSCSEPFWRDTFLKRYGLFDGIKGHCEVTDGGIKRERMDEDGVEHSTKPQYIKMQCLRIGKYKQRGATVKATAQINNGQFHSNSVTFNHKHRTARRRLFNDIRDDFTKYLFDDRIDEVMRWVEMTDVFGEPLPGNTDVDSDGSDVDSDGSDVEEDKVVEKAAAVGADEEDEKKPPAGKDLNKETFADINPAIAQKFMAFKKKHDDYLAARMELIKEIKNDPTYQEKFATSEELHTLIQHPNTDPTSICTKAEMPTIETPAELQRDFSLLASKEDPHLKKGTVVIFPCLHGMLGVGNAIMDFFFDEIDRFVEPITRAELAVRESIPNNKSLLEEEENSLTLWDAAPEGGKELKRLGREIGRVVRPMTQEMHNQLLDKESRINALTEVRKKMTNNIAKLTEEISSAKKKLEAFRKKRKVTNSSIYNGVERIFKIYNIVRAAYHGGDFNGVNIITLMQKSQQIMTQIQQFMIENKRDHTTEQELITLCNEVRKALVLWDDVFSKANKEYESTTVDWVTKHCDDTQKSIEQAMFQMRLMGFSITPKMHGLECHLVHLMRTIPGGIHQMIEHWVEQYHQKAAEMERMWTGHPYEEQAGFCVRRENMLSKKGTMDAGVRVKDSLRKQKRKRTETTLAEEERIREARRLIKQEVQEKMDIEAGEGSIDIDGNDGTIGTL